MKRCPGCKYWNKKLQKSGLCTECDSKGVGYRSMNNSHSAIGELADIPARFVVPDPRAPCPYGPYTGERAAWMQARAEAGLPLRMAGDA